MPIIAIYDIMRRCHLVKNKKGTDDAIRGRYSNRAGLGIDDAQRTEIAIKGAEGKRLTYRRTRSQKAA
jgi:hypothetical protein